MTPLESKLTPDLIRKEAGDRTYQDGEDAYYGGMVQSLSERDGVFRADVLGSALHKTELGYDPDNDELEYDCSCQEGENGKYCKHLVAVALSILDRMNDPQLFADDGADYDVEEIRRFLKRIKKDEIIDFVIGQLGSNENLRNRLSLEAALADHKSDEQALRNVIEQAAFIEDFIEAEQVPTYVEKVDNVLDVIQSLIDRGEAERVMNLTVHAVGVLEDALDSMDDPYDQAAALLRRLGEIHRKACERVAPDPEWLARQLLELELHSERGAFSNAFEKYGDVLGEKGRNAYRSLVEERWSETPDFSPGDVNPQRFGVQGKLSKIMETLARDSTHLIEIKSKDLSTPYDFLEIAELYRDDDQPEKAREWAERGLSEFSESTATCLPAFLAEEHQNHGRHELAMEMAWKIFVNAPNLDSYKTLRGFAERGGDWPEFRKRTLVFLQDHIRKVKAETGPVNVGPMADFSRLVEIHLWENDVESAWKDASVGGCSEDLWLRLASLRENDFPKDAVEIYQRRVRGILARDDVALYDEAIDLLGKIKHILFQLGNVKEFSDFLADLLTSNYRRRDFISLLKTSKL